MGMNERARLQTTPNLKDAETFMPILDSTPRARLQTTPSNVVSRSNITHQLSTRLIALIQVNKACLIFVGYIPL